MTTDLGKVYTAGQVAEYMNLDVNTVRRYYKQLGGIRVGAAYRFFERTLTDAILRQAETEVCRTNKKEWKIRSEILSDPEGSVQVGDRSGGKSKPLEAIDKYNLLN